MMRDRLTKRFREVDVVIKGKVGSQPVIVAIECRDHKRVADVTWVDMMKAKHERLDTHALLLASRSGFTPEARAVAAKYGIQLFTLEDVENTDMPSLFGSHGSLWWKTVEITAEKASVRVSQVDALDAEIVATMPDNLLYVRDGSELCQIKELVEKLLKSPQAMDHVLAEGTEEHRWFELVWEPPNDHEGNPLFMKKLEPEILRPIESLRVTGPCKVQVGRFGMRHGKIGDVSVAWGKALIAGRDAMAVVTAAQSGETKLSFNFSGPPK